MAKPGTRMEYKRRRKIREGREGEGGTYQQK
jgi:hypothetical protein